ncbi:coiled-coil domain-containing protein 57 isoform X2 [Cricetulus griseus]|uniref:Coiled-coil domain-containing protein 57 isoform X2 n=1 Tax=Cricetulus griseus TaxID=10029 RepID=A0A9J7KA52_CRIGR|nr:coiled-coil domain-containing protein 57 isoform X2 [Cricetulus griseus]XP_035303826.1 coiled-coil domain-containing protein 57 isoform X2 [Cricetulus griseus]
MLPLCSEKELGELLARKEEEWRALQAHRAQLQETTLQTTRKHLEETQGKLQRLQEDFVYNLQVLEERDRELERYDVEFTQARRREEAHQAEASELKIEVAKLKQALTRETRHVEELQHRHQLMLQEHHLELERIHSDKKSEVDHHQGQYESLKWTLERKLRELDGELALQRQELLQEFESEIQRKDHEFQLRADDMSNVVLTHELKVKLLNKELQALREAGAQATESLQKAKAEHIQLQRKLQDHALELQSLEAVKDARIKDLEKKLQSVQLARKRAEETFRRKNEELDRQAREKDTLLAAVKGSHAKQLHELEAKMLELQAHCETLEGQLRKAEWIRADDAKEKNALIDKLHEDAAALKAAWDAQITQMSKEAVSKDLQVQKLQEEEAKLKAQVAGFQKDIDRYKQQLSLAVEREQSLERDHVQLGLDWQRRCDDVERDHIQRSEALIRGLTRARDQVSAKLEETEKALHRQETLLKAVSLERDQAMETLRRHGLLPGQEAQVPPQQRDRETRKDFPSSEIQRLQEQNAGLRNAVAQMRREMELLSGHLPSAHPEECPDANPGAKAAGGPALPEIQNLKHKLEVLEEQRQGVREPVKTSLPTDDPHPGAAVTDQACIALALRKLGDRVHLLNLLVTQLKKKLWQKPLEPVTVQHELPGEVDQVHLEVVELQKQVAELRKHVKVAGPRGEPAYTEQLQREGLTDWRPMVTMDQTEFTSLPQEGAQPPQTLSVPHLQKKLKDAARKIRSLSLEREQLLEMGNRLRAELGHPKGKLTPCTLPPTSESRDPRERPETPLDPGLPLKQLQPHSTTQDPRHTTRKCVSEYLGENQPHSVQVGSKCNIPRGYTAGVASRPAQKQHRVPTETLKSVCQKENRSPKLPPQAQEVPEESDHHTHRSSSLTSSSLQDTWKLLDLGSSLSGVTSQDDSAAERLAPPGASCLQKVHQSPVTTQSTFAVKGLKMEAQPKVTHPRPRKAHPAEPTNCWQRQRHPRIRNYNLKD